MMIIIAIPTSAHETVGVEIKNSSLASWTINDERAVLDFRNVAFERKNSKAFEKLYFVY